MINFGSAISIAFLIAGIHSILKLQRTMKWKPVPAIFKAALIAYYIIAVVASINSIVGHEVRPLSSVILILSATLFTMNAMATFTPQNDTNDVNSVQK